MKFKVLLLIVCIMFCGCSYDDYVFEELTVSYVNVQQGDCTIIELTTGEVIMIDAGESNQAENIMQFMEQHGIDKVDTLIATHPHSDHIGGMSEIIRNFDIQTLYMPNVEHTTKTYQEFLETILEYDLNVIQAKAGVIHYQDDFYDIRFVAPNGDEYDDLNDYSAVLRLEYGKTSFLFTGDAEAISENEMIQSGYEISADILKVGHHGSSSSSTKEFLAEVKPSVAIISCDGESYGFPHDEVIENLQGVTIYKTFVDGDVIIKSNGLEYSYESYN